MTWYRVWFNKPSGPNCAEVKANSAQEAESLLITDLQKHTPNVWLMNFVQEVGDAPSGLCVAIPPEEFDGKE